VLNIKNKKPIPFLRTGFLGQSIKKSPIISPSVAPNIPKIDIYDNHFNRDALGVKRKL